MSAAAATAAEGGPFARCGGCGAPGRPQTCLPAQHPQKRAGALQCPRCPHAWEWRTATQRWCPLCRTSENVQGGLF